MVTSDFGLQDCGINGVTGLREEESKSGFHWESGNCDVRVESRGPTSCIKLEGGIPSWWRMSHGGYEREFAECKWLSIPRVLGGWRAVCIWLGHLFHVLASDLRTLSRHGIPYLIGLTSPPFPTSSPGQTGHFLVILVVVCCFSVCWEEGGVWELNWEEWKAEGGLPPPRLCKRVLWWGLCLRPRWSLPVLNVQKGYWSFVFFVELFILRSSHEVPWPSSDNTFLHELHSSEARSPGSCSPCDPACLMSPEIQTAAVSAKPSACSVSLTWRPTDRL